MLFMLTPEIKTNLILKEIGVKRYSYRTNQPKSKEKNLNYFQKGLILTLLDKPFENFVDEQQNLIRAIVGSTLNLIMVMNISPPFVFNQKKISKIKYQIH